jgi:serine/threonine protein kinase
VSADRYTISKKLGEGNFTTGVFLAEHRDLHRTVALKLLTIGPGDHRDDLLREAQAMAAMPRHDHVVQVFDAGDWDATSVYIASEPCMGGSLEEKVESTPQDPGAACRLISDVCRGLQHLHSHGLLHLDVRPANILLTDGCPKLCDFGLARWVTNANVPMVYAPHAAPEMLATYDGSALSDQYAMAMTLAHALSAGAVCSTPPDPPDPVSWRKWAPLTALPLSVPTKLKRVLKKATSYSPADRYETVEDFKRAIDSATPAISFQSVSATSMASVDGVWTLDWHGSDGSWTVDVRKNGRRKGEMTSKGEGKSALIRQLESRITGFAYPR